MRKGLVYCNKTLAGILVEHDNQGPFTFTYNSDYFQNPKLRAISLTLPKSQKEYRSESLFPFFFNMIAEGVNKELQERKLHIDENDSFGLLLATAQYDTIGSVTIKPIEEDDK